MTTKPALRLLNRWEPVPSAVPSIYKVLFVCQRESKIGDP